MRALGIDYGERRIGLALSDVTGLLARPWKTIPNDGNLKLSADTLMEEARRLMVEDDGLEAIVIGLPRRLSGEANTQTARVQQFAAAIGSAIDVPVVLQDERLTSHEADALLARSERDWRRRKQQVDATAAAIILQDYLDSRPRTVRSDDDPA
jgi:putative Holliday junction resolvase